jgi:tRNA-dihydrouridine synthase
MIGRACIGNPWLIKECINYIEYNEEPVLISLEERINMIKKHISYLLLYKPEKVVVLEMRMHIAKYLKGINGCSELKVQINKVKSILEINNLLDEFLKEKNNEQ